MTELKHYNIELYYIGICFETREIKLRSYSHYLTYDGNKMTLRIKYFKVYIVFIIVTDIIE